VRTAGWTRPRDERGIVAVVVAMMAMTLLGVSALAVDMGNAYARKQQVQSEVDLAALAGGAKLPARTAAAQTLVVTQVLDYLVRNQTFGQDASSWTVLQLQDGSLSNGEVVFETPNRISVTAPPARVDFGLAGAMGFDSVDVSATATVEIRSPGNVLPMWLPSSCAIGQTMGDTSANGSSNEDTAATFQPPKTDPQLDLTIDPATAAAGSTVSVAVTINDLPVGSLSAKVAFSYGPEERASFPLTWTVPTTNKDNSRQGTISVGTDVTSTSGTWQVWAVSQSAGDAEAYSKDSQPFTVTGDVVLGCSASQRGNFGQIRSPRLDVNQKMEAYALNLALGLDHSLVPFDPGMIPLDGVCSSGLPPEALDDEPARDDRNCIYVDPGNDGPGLTGGLITGVDEYPGRLAGSTTCSDRQALVIQDVSLNNDVLSCFLPPGTPVGAISTVGLPAQPEVLSEEIFSSVRFYWVPVLSRDERDGKRFLAIEKFAPVFLTDESPLATNGNSDASATNGITMNAGGTQVSSVQIIAFDPAAMPETTAANGGSIPYLGSGTRVITLVE